MPLSEQYLKGIAGRVKPGSPVTEDRTCRRCGYSLRGLRMNMVCPECGTPIRPLTAARFTENLVDAPMEYLKRLRLGLGILSLSVLLLIGGLIASIFAPFSAVAGAAVILGFLWSVGVYLLTTPRPVEHAFEPDPVLDSAKLIAVCRWTQALTVPAGLALLTGALLLSTSAGPIVLIGAGVLYLGAVLSLVPLSIYLAGLSDWAGHAPLGSQFRTVVIMITLSAAGALLSAMLAVTTAGLRGLAAIITMWAVIATTLASGWFLMLVLRLTHSAQWAVANSLFSMQTEARLAERKAREAEAMAARMTTQAPPPHVHRERWEEDAAIPLAGDDLRPGDAAPYDSPCQ